MVDGEDAVDTVEEELRPVGKRPELISISRQ
jgi:hypothetical protein